MTKRFFSSEERARKTLARFAERWMEPDRQALSSPGVADTMAASLVESLRQGTKGVADGTLVGGCNWRFELEAISFPEIYLWHGELDKDIPVVQAIKVAERLTHCKAIFYPNDGYISTIINHGEEIVATLVVA